MKKKAIWHKAKISFGLQKYKGELKRMGGGDKRRREDKEKKKKNKRRRKKEEEFKEYSKVWNITLSMDYLDFLYGYMFVGCGL